jgi:colicin import membrane protein
MARKLKTFQTSLGFYDLAIAAPSMKVALETWGAGSNLFHQGVAKETDDPDVVAATISRPGVVLKRPAGSNGRFAEQSGLPTDLGDDDVGRGRSKNRPRPKKGAPSKISETAARKAALEFDREQARQQAQRRREEAANVSIMLTSARRRPKAATPHRHAAGRRRPRPAMVVTAC